MYRRGYTFRGGLPLSVCCLVVFVWMMVDNASAYVPVVASENVIKPRYDTLQEVTLENETCVSHAANESIDRYPDTCTPATAGTNLSLSINFPHTKRRILLISVAFGKDTHLVNDIEVFMTYQDGGEIRLCNNLSIESSTQTVELHCRTVSPFFQPARKYWNVLYIPRCILIFRSTHCW